MSVSRRGFIKLLGAGTAALGLARLGIDLGPAQAYAAGLKIEGAKETISICPFCSCGCNLLVHAKDGKIINVEGDPDFPISGGGLCAKGASHPTKIGCEAVSTRSRRQEWMDGKCHARALSIC